MAKSELYSNPLIPIVLVAGVLSGSLWRGTPPASNAIPAPGDLHVAPLPPLPAQFSIGAVVVLVIVALHLWVMLSIKRAFDDPAAHRAFFEWPLVRVLVPPGRAIALPACTASRSPSVSRCCRWLLRGSWRSRSRSSCRIQLSFWSPSRRSRHGWRRSTRESRATDLGKW